MTWAFTMRKSPRLIKLLAAVLVGAGIFLFISLAADASRWYRWEDALRRAPRSGPESGDVCAEGVAVLGSSRGPEGARARLAADLNLLAQAGPRAIFLEAWLDEPLQAGAKELADQLMGRFGGTLLKAAYTQPIRKVLEGIGQEDRLLGETLQVLDQVVLPVSFRPSPLEVRPNSLQKPLGYQVSLKRKGRQTLGRYFEAGRIPMPGLEIAAHELAGVEHFPRQQGDEEKIAENDVPCLYEVNRQWVNSYGFVASLRYWGLENKALRFHWKAVRLEWVQLKGQRYALSPQGAMRLPGSGERVHVPELQFQRLEESAEAAKGLKDKVVFYRPWPESLAGGEGFDRQRDLFAAVMTRTVGRVPPDASGRLLWFLPWAALIALASLGRGRFVVIGAAAWLGFVVEEGIRNGDAFIFPLGLLLSAALAAWGVLLWTKLARHEAREAWFRGVIAFSSEAFWRTKMPRPREGGSAFGVYAVLLPPGDRHSAQLDAFASKWDAFMDWEVPGMLGLFLPAKKDCPFPVPALEELRDLFSSAPLAAARGSIIFEPRMLLNDIFWDLKGSPKSEALAMVANAQKGNILVTETDYEVIRDLVRIQMVGEARISLENKEKRVFNILGSMETEA